jgi:hypothetical protein
VAKEIKPRLLLEKPKRGDGKSKLKLFLVFIVSFTLGVFIGMRIDNVNVEIAKKKEIETSGLKTGVQGEKPDLNYNPNLKGSIATGGKIQVHDKEGFGATTVSSGPMGAISGESRESKESEPNRGIDRANENEYRYTIQVAAFKDSEMEMAEAFMNKLKDKGYDAYIVPIHNSRGEAWNLLRVGKFKTKEEATDLADLLYKKEGMETLVYEVSGELRNQRRVP